MPGAQELKADEVTVRISIARVGRVYGVEGATLTIEVVGADGRPIRPPVSRHVAVGRPGQPITVDVGPVLVDERLRVGELPAPAPEKFQRPGPEVPLLDVEDEPPPEEKPRGNYPA